MDITRQWTSSTTEEAKPVVASPASVEPQTVRPRLVDSGDVELSSLGGYALVILIMAACMLLSASISSSRWPDISADKIPGCASMASRRSRAML